MPLSFTEPCCYLYSDLVPRESVEKWLKYLREESPTVAFKCSTQEQRSNLGWKAASKAAKPSNILQTSDCLGAETLLKLLKNYSRSHEVLLACRVGKQYLSLTQKSLIIKGRIHSSCEHSACNFTHTDRRRCFCSFLNALYHSKLSLCSQTHFASVVLVKFIIIITILILPRLIQNIDVYANLCMCLLDRCVVFLLYTDFDV